MKRGGLQSLAALGGEGGAAAADWSVEAAQDTELREWGLQGWFGWLLALRLADPEVSPR